MNNINDYYPILFMNRNPTARLGSSLSALPDFLLVFMSSQCYLSDDTELPGEHTEYSGGNIVYYANFTIPVGLSYHYYFFQLGNSKIPKFQC